MTIHSASSKSPTAGAPTSRMASIWLASACVAAFLAAGCGGGTTASGTTPESGSTGEAASSATPDATGSGPAAAGPTVAEVGKQAPEIAAAYVTGAGPKTLAEAKGKVVIVDFWGTYCGPCKASFPKYQELLEQFGSDLAIIAISEDDPDDAKESNLKDFAKKTGVKFTILWDKTKAMGKTYNPPNMPTSFIIDKEGKIVSIHAKYENGDEKKIAEEVKALIKK